MRFLSKDSRVHEIAAHTPCAYTVEPGEAFVVATQDAMDGQIPAEGRCVAEVDATRANPMTGPIYVQGARPGQVLAIQILEVAVDPLGWMSSSPLGLLNRVEGNLVTFVEGVRLPLDPMIGVMGVAPAQGGYTGKDAGPCGGNLDIKEIGAGTTVFSPVQVEGAHLVMGDVHALQADGECSGTGIEIGARITLRVQVLERGLCEGIYFYRRGILSTVGTAPDLREACAGAVSLLAGIVSRASGLDATRSRMFLSLMADVHVGQFVCPIQSAYASLDTRTCPWPIDLGIRA